MLVLTGHGLGVSIMARIMNLLGLLLNFIIGMVKELQHVGQIGVFLFSQFSQIIETVDKFLFEWQVDLVILLL
jgi:hypothetical protein